MADDKDKKLTLKTLSLKTDVLKKKELGTGRSSSVQGSRKTVTVEVLRRRSPQDSAEPNMRGRAEPNAMVIKRPTVTDDDQGTLPTKPKGLSDQEWQQRIDALKDALASQGDNEKVREEIMKMREAEFAMRKQDLSRIEDDQRRRRDSAKVTPSVVDVAAPPSVMDVRTDQDRKTKNLPPRGKSFEEEEAEARQKKATASKGFSEDTRHRPISRISVRDALEMSDDIEVKRSRSMASIRRAREKERKRQMDSAEMKKIVREIILPEFITVQELANRMAERSAAVIKTLLNLGVMATANQTIDADTAELAATELGHTVRRVTEADVELGLPSYVDDEATMTSRAPVVTIMGHVDHGKTSLLDAIRDSDVAAREAGQITQHIGAYQVQTAQGKKITFIDTPGHAAFSQMRARGANVTDIVVLVVAANDSVKDQTIEAIHHAKAAKVPIIVAVNKVDLPDANPARVKTDLLQHEIVVEDMSGDILCVEVSAKQKLGIDKLEEAILLQAEMLELRANPNRIANGSVIESRVEKGRGPVATILVQGGTLKVGDIFVAGTEYGRVRALTNERNQQLKMAGPGSPVEVIGFSGSANAGDDFVVVDNENRAREIAEYRMRKKREAQIATTRKTMDQLLSENSNLKELAVIVKADVQGSQEAICASLNKIVHEEARVRVLGSGVGGINESDISLAMATKALIVGFNVRANTQARDLAQREGIEIRYYSIIYDIIDDAKAALSGLLSPTLRETYCGTAEVLEVFNVTKVGKVAGCVVRDGVIKRGARVRLLRDDVVIHEGTLKTLRRFKDEAAQVTNGNECGVAFENFQDMRAGDRVECFEVTQEARQI